VAAAYRLFTIGPANERPNDAPTSAPCTLRLSALRMWARFVSAEFSKDDAVAHVKRFLTRRRRLRGFLFREFKRGADRARRDICAAAMRFDLESAPPRTSLEKTIYSARSNALRQCGTAMT
jgi:hypothetical protein